MTLKNDLIIRAALGQEVERVPIWLMRQAGRVLPEYRALRSTFSDFKAFIKHPEAAAEATVQPIKRFGMDAAIIFSDILVIPEAMGLDYEMIEKKGPFFPKKIKTKEDIDQLIVGDGNQGLEYVHNAIRHAKQLLNNDIPLIGFAGAPWTIFAYMTEGSGSKTFSEAKKWLYVQPELSHILLQKITDNTINYLKKQIEAGADMVQVFDSWAGVLTPTQYEEFSLRYINQIIEAIKTVPITIFAKDAFYARKMLAQTNCNTIGLDWCMNPIESRAIIGNHKTLQGNLDPCALYGDFKSIQKNVTNMLDQFGKQKYIANLGHGLYPDINPDHVKYMVDIVKNYQ